MHAATSTSLEDRALMGENRLPALAHVARELFLNTFSPQRRLLHEMEGYKQRKKYEDAAQCAVRLRDYDQAFALYDAMIHDGDTIKGALLAAELAELRGDYERALNYRLREGNLIMAGFDAASLGRTEEARGYWWKLCHPDVEKS